MRTNRLVLLTVLCLTAFPAAMLAFRILPGAVTPMVMGVTPRRTTPNQSVTLTGFGLGQAMVRSVYLVDAKDQYRVEILQQTDTVLRFRVPAKIVPGRKRLTLEVSGCAEGMTDCSTLVEQDFYLDIDPVELEDAPIPFPAQPTGGCVGAQLSLAPSGK